MRQWEIHNLVSFRFHKYTLDCSAWQGTFRAISVQLSCNLPLRQLLVHLHQFGDDVAFGHIGFEAVGLHYRLVVGLVSLTQLWRHREFIVEVGEGAL